jgi:hypothetical protein
MANVLTGLIQNAYKAWNVVSREKVGFLTAMYMPPAGTPIGLAPGGVTQTYRVPIAAAASTANNTAAVTPPDTGSETSTYADVTMTKSKHVPVRFTGEEQLGLTTSGDYDMLYQARLQEAFRALVNEMEADAYALIRVNSSRAYGTAATPPFATAADLQDLSNVALILDDNGCPSSDRQIVLANNAINNLRGKQSQLFKVNEAGSAEMLRDGFFGRLEGFSVRQSGQISTITKGTGINYVSDLVAGYAIGDTTVHVDTGTGTILAGDFVTFAGDTNKYIVKTGFAGDGDGDIVLQSPGLKQTLANDVALTVGGSSRHNLAFDRASVVWLTREPAMGNDMAIAQSNLQDPATGMIFGLAIYPGFGQTTVHVRLAWGGGVVKGAHIATLLG